MELINFGGEEFLFIESVEHLSDFYVSFLVGLEEGLLWAGHFIRSKILCKTEIFLSVFIGY